MQPLLNDLLDFYEILHICSTLPANVHEGIWLLSKFKRLDNSTYTFTKRGSCTLQAQLLLNDLLDFYETLHSCSTQTADAHEGIPLLSKI